MTEENAGMSIIEIFSKLGESYFRGLEKKAVLMPSKLKNHIIVTGGSVVLKKEKKTESLSILMHSQR